MAKYEATISRAFFDEHFYSDLDGRSGVRADGGGTVSPDGLVAIAYKPWWIQVAEEVAPGIWGVSSHLGPFYSKDESIAAAERMGIEVDHVDWHDDFVRVSVILPDDYDRIADRAA